MSALKLGKTFAGTLRFEFYKEGPGKLSAAGLWRRCVHTLSLPRTPSHLCRNCYKPRAVSSPQGPASKPGAERCSPQGTRVSPPHASTATRTHRHARPFSGRLPRAEVTTGPGRCYHRVHLGDSDSGFRAAACPTARCPGQQARPEQKRAALLMPEYCRLVGRWQASQAPGQDGVSAPETGWQGRLRGDGKTRKEQHRKAWPAQPSTQATEEATPGQRRCPGSQGNYTWTAEVPGPQGSYTWTAEVPGATRKLHLDSGRCRQQGSYTCTAEVPRGPWGSLACTWRCLGPREARPRQQRCPEPRALRSGRCREQLKELQPGRQECAWRGGAPAEEPCGVGRAWKGRKQEAASCCGKASGR